MELTAGQPFWLIKDGLINHYPKLGSDKKTNVVIIGGGITGTLVAYQLVKAGIGCILLDARSIGLGSTCASTSLLQYEMDIPLHLLSKQIGRKKAQRAYQCCGEAIEKLVAIMQESGYRDFETNPSLFFSTHKKEADFIKKEWQARKEAGFAVSLLDAGEMREDYGLKASHGILSATGASISTYTLTHHLLQACLDKGLEVYDRTRVLQIREQNDQVLIICENGCQLQAGYVVNACGYEVVNFIGNKIVDFDCTYAIVTEHQAEQQTLWKDRALLWNTDDPYLYLRLTHDNRILAGGRDEPFSTKITRQLYLEKKARLLEKDIKKILPRLEFKTEFAWSGTFGKTKDSLPYIGSLPHLPTILYALGFGGNGITFGQVAAEIIRDTITGTKNQDAALFSFTR